MTHLWLRAEQRPNEERAALTPEGAKDLIDRGFSVTVEESRNRVFATADYRKAGAEIAGQGSWPDAPRDAIILGLKELPDDGTSLPHRHIMFGHAFKGQTNADTLLRRFRDGGGTLYDLEYLTDEDGRRLAAFGYWAGYAGAGVSLMAWVAQAAMGICPPISTWPRKEDMLADLRDRLDRAADRPDAIVIGAKGRVGHGAADLCRELDIAVTEWDKEETAPGGPFPEIAGHSIFLNCILAMPGAPVFVPEEMKREQRKLTVIGDIACDPGTHYSPIKVYDRVTSWNAPAKRVGHDPVLDVVAIDNLPSLLPRESSEDFAAQLLPLLHEAGSLDTGAWGRSKAAFDRAMTEELA